MFPLHAEEDSECIVSVPLQVVSHQFVMKVIYVGVVTKPYPAHKFDGKIDLLQVAEEQECKKTMCLDNVFFNEPERNEAVKNGWQNIAFDDMKCIMLLHAITREFCLDDKVTQHLWLKFKQGNWWKEVSFDWKHNNFKDKESLSLQLFVIMV